MSKSNAARQPALRKPLESTSPNFQAKSPFQRWGTFALDMLMSGAAPWPARGSCGHSTESFNFELIGRIFSKAKMEDLLEQALIGSPIKGTPWAKELFDVINFLWTIGHETKLDEAKTALRTRGTYIMFLDLKTSKEQYDATSTNPFLRRENFFIKLEWLNLNSEETEIWQRAFKFFTGGMNEKAGLSPTYNPRSPQGLATVPMNTIDEICGTKEREDTYKSRLARKDGNYHELMNIDEKWKDSCEDPSDSDFTIETKTSVSHQSQKEKRLLQAPPSSTAFNTTNREPSHSLPIRTSSASVDAPSESVKSSYDGLSMIERQFRKRQRANTVEKDEKLALAIETIATYEIWMTDIAIQFGNNDIDKVRKIVDTSKKLYRVESMAKTVGVDAKRIVKRIFDQELATPPLELNKKWDKLA